MSTGRPALRGACAVLLTAAAGALAACSGESSLRCEEPGEYVTSRSAPPLRVPEGLSPPSEDDALRVPAPRTPPPGEAAGLSADESDGQGGGEAAETGRCLERPPEYFEGGA